MRLAGQASNQGLDVRVTDLSRDLAGFPLQSFIDVHLVARPTYQVSAAPAERKRGRRLLQTGVGRPPRSKQAAYSGPT